MTLPSYVGGGYGAWHSLSPATGMTFEQALAVSPFVSQRLRPFAATGTTGDLADLAELNATRLESRPSSTARRKG